MESDPTFPKRVASIDIGTNTILLLIAEVEGGILKPLLERETIVRLGEGVQKNGVLSEGAMAKGIQTLIQYLKECETMRVQKVFAVGTSVLREAENSAQFLHRVKEKFDLSIEIISGEEEARFSFLAIVKDSKEFEKSILVIDVGGGSTEFIWGKGDQIDQWVSLPVGSVRFTELFLLSDPVDKDEWEEMRREVLRQFEKIPNPRQPFVMVAVGGTATTLASVEQGLKEFVPQKIHHFILRKKALENQLLLFRAKTLDERRKIRGLPPARADVILTGGTILYLAMEKLACPSVLISCHGVRHGLLYKKISNFRFPI